MRSWIGVAAVRVYAAPMRRIGRIVLVWILPAVVMLLVLGRPSGLARFFAVHEVTPSEVMRALAAEAPPLLLDVRTEQEYRDGHVAGAIWVPLGQLGGYVASGPVSAEREVVTV